MGNALIPSVSVKYAHDGRSAKADALGMRPMQARVWLQRGERYLLIKSPPASGKSRALMFVALDKLRHQGLKQALVAPFSPRATMPLPIAQSGDNHGQPRPGNLVPVHHHPHTRPPFF